MSDGTVFQLRSRLWLSGMRDTSQVRNLLSVYAMALEGVVLRGGEVSPLLFCSKCEDARPVNLRLLLALSSLYGLKT